MQKYRKRPPVLPASSPVTLRIIGPTGTPLFINQKFDLDLHGAKSASDGGHHPRPLLPLLTPLPNRLLLQPTSNNPPPTPAPCPSVSQTPPPPTKKKTQTSSLQTFPITFVLTRKLGQKNRLQNSFVPFCFCFGHGL